MPHQPGAALIAEIGSITTRLTLIDVVEGEFRLLGQAETLSTVDLPNQDAMVAVLDAAAQIETQTSRKLLKGDGSLLIPQSKEQDGVDRFVAVTSATELLSLVITAIASDVSARSALHASRCTYTSVLQVVTLDDAPRQEVNENERSWIERQVQTLLGLRPDVVLLAGGLEGGAEHALKRLAHIVGLTSVRAGGESNMQQRQDVLARPVLFAGNSVARDDVLAALDGRSKAIVVDNVRPSLEREQLEPTRRALTTLYEEEVLAKQPGLGALRRASNVPLTTVCAAHGLMARFLGQQYARQVLLVDVGAAHSGAYLYSGGRYTPTVLGNCGLGFGVSSVLQERGVESIARWLPFPISNQDLTHRVLNKLLRPQLEPVSREDLWLELALTREIIMMIMERLRDERPELHYDMLVLSGSVFAHAAHPGLSLLAALDALQPDGNIGGASASQDAASGLLLDIYVDSLGLLAAAGAIAPLNADAAVTLCERDFLRNTPLAKCIIAQGDGRVGDIALEAELTSARGKTQHVSVRYGEIARLPLDQGSRGQITLRPAPGVRIGAHAPGTEVSSDMAAIEGSALGVVIDARSRPLTPTRDGAQRNALWTWMQTLGAMRGPNPYQDMVVPEPTPAIVVPEMPASEAPTVQMPSASSTESPTATMPILPPVVGMSEVSTSEEPQRGRRISLDELAQQEARARSSEEPPAASAPKNLENDLAQLRQTVEAPKKRGLFGRKK